MITKTHTDDINGQLRGLGALSASKMEAKKLRNAVIKNCLRLMETHGRRLVKVDVEAGIDGLAGLAGCQYRPKGYE